MNSQSPIRRWLLIVCLCACPVLLHGGESIEELRKKAEQDDAIAQRILAACHTNADGVVKNEAEAVKWYREAAEQGDAQAQSNLGACYANGHGVMTNDLEGYKWFLLAAAKGRNTAKGNASMVESRLSPERRVKGQRLASEWQPAFEKKQKNE